MNIKQNVRMKIWQMNLDIFSNQILLELIDFIQIKMQILKYLKLKDIIYRKVLSKITTSSSIEKTFMTK